MNSRSHRRKCSVRKCTIKITEQAKPGDNVGLNVESDKRWDEHSTVSLTRLHVEVFFIRVSCIAVVITFGSVRKVKKLQMPIARVKNVYEVF